MSHNIESSSSAEKAKNDFINSDENKDGNFSDDDDDDDNDNEENTSDTRNTKIEKWINVNDSELKKLLKINVNVVIDFHLIIIDYSLNEFDLETTPDNVLGT
ncbi:hypothetical protein C1645_819998 [Glomus cerebriforme]|uniref:Uncharacterized protein n=1 Tax=Glomus cerebriforme TaxID=658196 RepID=A0A397T9F9_9GLOM|nr:hypothetical protein C1645_819998 [Glomus cerebriforme]